MVIIHGMIQVAVIEGIGLVHAIEHSVTRPLLAASDSAVTGAAAGLNLDLTTYRTQAYFQETP